MMQYRTGVPPAADKVLFRMGANRGAISAVILAITMSWSGLVRAGPPYVTDDPEPTDTGHWEIYGFLSGVHVPDDTAGQGGLDINYGGARDLQLTVVLPADVSSRVAPGLGDIELAAKYRFPRQAPGSWIPDVAVFPRLIVPTAPRRLGGGEVAAFLPIWAEKDFGPWSVFGGGGYFVNPGPGNRDYWRSGLTLTRAITARLTLGAEIYHQTPAIVGGGAFTGLNGGATWRLSKYWSLLAAAGPGLQNARQGGQYDLYVAVEATY
jgi:hypothetical protein